MYRFVRFRIWSFFMIGFVCACGGRFISSLIIFLCVLISGCMYSLLFCCVPHTVIDPIRCG